MFTVRMVSKSKILMGGKIIASMENTNPHLFSGVEGAKWTKKKNKFFPNNWTHIFYSLLFTATNLKNRNENKIKRTDNIKK